MPTTTLSWGAKQSFRGYVEASGGTITVAEGASRAPDGGFLFAPAPGREALAFGADGAPHGRGAFQGEVRFRAHGGMLDVFLADPAVEIGPDRAALTVADSPARDRRVELARLDLAALGRDADGALVLPATITLDGMMLLGDHYPPGTPLDPVRLLSA